MTKLVSKLESAPRPEWSSFLLLRVLNGTIDDFISFAITKKAGTEGGKGAQIIIIAVKSQDKNLRLSVCLKILTL